MTVAATVLAAVISTLSATSPCATKVATLEACPPGQQPSRMRPVAKAGGRLMAREMSTARMGSTEYWHTNPSRMGTGLAAHCGVAEGQELAATAQQCRSSRRPAAQTGQCRSSAAAPS